MNHVPGHKKEEDLSSNHVAAPLSTLKDPSSFAPPPKRTGAGLEAAPKAASPVKRQVITAPSKYQDPRAPKVEPPPKNSGVGLIPAAPEEYEDEEEEKPKGPYRLDTTGLSTNNFARPPGRRDGADGREPPPYSEVQGRASPQKALPPSLPPRLPPRVSPASTGDSAQLNQGAVSRLGAAGVSVPALGIGASPQSTGAKQSPGGWGTQVNELQGRFAKMNTSPQEPSEAQGTTWAQKQAALKTASSLQKDPSSVSFADAKAAASTANNFRQRHGDQIAAGAQKANSLNQKYGIADKVGAYAGTQDPPAQAAAAKKKPPPPPPKKKPGLQGVAVTQDGAPPPIPMSTRPNF